MESLAKLHGFLGDEQSISPFGHLLMGNHNKAWFTDKRRIKSLDLSIHAIRRLAWLFLMWDCLRRMRVTSTFMTCFLPTIDPSHLFSSTCIKKLTKKSQESWKESCKSAFSYSVSWIIQFSNLKSVISLVFFFNFSPPLLDPTNKISQFCAVPRTVKWGFEDANSIWRRQESPAWNKNQLCLKANSWYFQRRSPSLRLHQSVSSV